MAVGFSWYKPAVSKSGPWKPFFAAIIYATGLAIPAAVKFIQGDKPLVSKSGNSPKSGHFPWIGYGSRKAKKIPGPSSGDLLMVRNRTYFLMKRLL
jgi:hypothetical protein